MKSLMDIRLTIDSSDTLSLWYSFNITSCDNNKSSLLGMVQKDSEWCWFSFRPSLWDAQSHVVRTIRGSQSQV